MIDPRDDGTCAPPLRLLLAEARAPFEILRFLRGAPRLRDLPRGDGHPVILIPGFGADGLALVPLRRSLESLGYAAEDWGQGRNLGMRPAIRDALARRLEQLAHGDTRAVTLIGWSLGGVFARELARAYPHRVRRVITLGSPINGSPDANNMVRLFRLANRGRTHRPDREAFERRKLAPPVPCTAIYTRSDGIVDWRASVEREAANTQNLEVRGSHVGLVFNLDVLSRLAEIMALDSTQLSDRR